MISFGSSQLVSIREGKLQHITGEREKRRDAIRKIAEDITIIDRVEGIKSSNIEVESAIEYIWIWHRIRISMG